MVDVNENGIPDVLDARKMVAERRMAWLALISAVLLAFGIVLLAATGFMEPATITSLGTVLGMFFAMTGGVVAAFLGISAFVQRNN